MIGFIFKRFIQSFIVMFLVALLAFTMFNFLGDPVNQMVGIDTTAADREALRDRLGLNDPLLIQFGRFVSNAVQFEFGQSYQHKRAVSGLILDRLPATLELSMIAAIFTLVVGVPMGVYTGLHRDSLLSKIFMTISLVGVSLPTFLIGILLIFVFSVQLQWLPSFGRGEVIDFGFWSTGLLTATGWKAIIMPAVTLGLFQMTLIMRLVRSEMLEVLRSDYIKFARARGLANRAINFGHALKNTLVPVITIAGLQLGSLIAFAIITETVFQWPGMGLLFLQAIQVVDIPIMAAYLMLIAFFFVMINMIVDLLYYVVDPRLRVDATS
ncbi:ABC transporter permease [Denitrobaculum tricleocarpae]|uniref:ABC transporter permease n=1 Tax=Denitrobaculum tricleocarpae TaxID=2591009 RepID=A0A545TXU0_9PROT|nr:ABC transporter permease [Denitrobaculum tricleocarpae]TQV82020.1 ABC transporter permease [Denitrobaculum tricleocarpae]